jgi:hypothetical protein
VTACHILSRCFLEWLILRPWRWKRYVPPKRRLTFNGLYGDISHHRCENLKSYIAFLLSAQIGGTNLRITRKHNICGTLALGAGKWQELKTVPVVVCLLLGLPPALFPVQMTQDSTRRITLLSSAPLLPPFINYGIRSSGITLLFNYFRAGTRSTALKYSVAHNTEARMVAMFILWRIDPLIGNDSVNTVPREPTRATICLLLGNGSVNTPKTIRDNRRRCFACEILER